MDHDKIPPDKHSLTKRHNFYYNTVMKDGKPKVILQEDVNHQHINFRANHGKKDI